MAAAEAGFEESLCEALSGINLETVSLRVKQKEAIRNNVLLKTDRLWQVINLLVVALRF